MKSVYVYAIICVVLILIGVGGYHFFTKGKTEPGESGEPETIVIGGGEKQTSGTENYMSMPPKCQHLFQNTPLSRMIRNQHH